MIIALFNSEFSQLKEPGSTKLSMWRSAIFGG